MNDTDSNLLVLCSSLPGTADVPAEIQVIPAGHVDTPKGSATGVCS